MHVHACQNLPMRTTIELDDDNRSRLLEIAARRGEKGFSHLVNDAVAQYLQALEKREEARKRALSRFGSLSTSDAESMRTTTLDIRRTWR